jgi:hypothetical protein
LSPLVLYVMSVICFVIANVIRDNSIVFYYLLLVLGLGLFVQGFTTKENKIISYFFRLLIINHRIYLKIGTLKLQFVDFSHSYSYFILALNLPSIWCCNAANTNFTTWNKSYTRLPFGKHSCSNCTLLAIFISSTNFLLSNGRYSVHQWYLDFIVFSNATNVIFFLFRFVGHKGISSPADKLNSSSPTFSFVFKGLTSVKTLFENVSAIIITNYPLTSLSAKWSRKS